MSDFGTPNYGGAKKEFKKKFDWKLHPGEQTYRIIPPRGNLKESGKWSVFYTAIYGYKNMQGKLRPFASPLVKNHETKAIDVRCAASELILNLKASLEKAKLEENIPMYTRLMDLVGYDPSTKKGGVYSIDINHHMNVVDLNGNVGKLRLRHRVKKKLDIEIDKLRAKGIDPLSPDNGRYFTFSQTGKGFDTDVKIVVYEKEIEAPGYGLVKQAVIHQIDTALAAKIREEAFDLDNVFPKITSEECNDIVKNADLKTGISSACNTIFDDRWKANRESNREQAQAPAPVTPSPVVLSPASASIANALAAATAFVVAPSVVKAEPAKSPVLAPDTSANYLENMSDDDFFAELDPRKGS